MTATSGIEVGTHLTPRCRQTIEQGLGFLANPGRGVYFGQGRDRGRRFRMTPGIGLSYECEQGTFEIPTTSIEALSPAILQAFSSLEYLDYQRTLSMTDSGNDEESMMLMTLVLCLEEDPLMYRLLHHASKNPAPVMLEDESVVCV